MKYIYCPKPCSQGVPYKNCLEALCYILKPCDWKKCILKISNNTVYVDTFKLLKMFSYVRTIPNDGCEEGYCEKCICGVEIKELNVLEYDGFEYNVGCVCIEGWKTIMDKREAYIVKNLKDQMDYCQFCLRKNKEGNHLNCFGKKDVKLFFKEWLIYTKSIRKKRNDIEKYGSIIVNFGKYNDKTVREVYQDNNYLNWLKNLESKKGRLKDLFDNLMAYELSIETYHNSLD